MRKALSLLLLIQMIFAGHSYAVASPRRLDLSKIPSKTEYRKDEILVKVANGASIYASVNKNEIEQEENILSTKNESATWKKLKLKNSQSLQSVADNLYKNGNILDIQMDYRVELYETTSTQGAGYETQWYLERCNIPQVWDLLEQTGNSRYGSENVTVAFIDTGLDISHTALDHCVWTNSKEIANNGIDDDNNGYKDDVHGANCVYNTNDITDVIGHGTKTAGVVAAKDTGYMQGIASNVKIMPCKIFDSYNTSVVSYLVKALKYAADNGADIINMSVGISGLSDVNGALKDAVNYAAQQAVLVASAGNAKDYIGKPNETVTGYTAEPNYPAAYPNVIGAMSETQTANTWGYLSNFSMWDPVPGNDVEYEIMAPGESIYTTATGNQYAYCSGTSFSAPILSGIFALLRSYYPDKTLVTNQALKDMVLNNAPYKSGFTYSNTSLSYRSADAFKAFTANQLIFGKINIAQQDAVAFQVSGAFELSFFIGNPSAEAYNVVLAAIILEDNKVNTVKIFQKSAPANQTTAFQEAVAIPADITNPKMRIVLWKDLSSLMPITQKAEQ